LSSILLHVGLNLFETTNKYSSLTGREPSEKIIIFVNFVRLIIAISVKFWCSLIWYKIQMEKLLYH